MKSNVKGLKYEASKSGSYKYFSVIHVKSGKYLVKSIGPVKRVTDLAKLADHVFRKSESLWKLSETAIQKHQEKAYGAVEQFKSALGQEHGRTIVQPHILEAIGHRPLRESEKKGLGETQSRYLKSVLDWIQKIYSSGQGKYLRSRLAIDPEDVVSKMSAVQLRVVSNLLAASYGSGADETRKVWSESRKRGNSRRRRH